MIFSITIIGKDNKTFMYTGKISAEELGMFILNNFDDKEIFSIHLNRVGKELTKSNDSK